MVGCSRGKWGEVDDQVVCSLEGKAYRVDPGAGSTSFIKPLPAADKLCQKLKD